MSHWGLFGDVVCRIDDIDYAEANRDGQGGTILHRKDGSYLCCKSDISQVFQTLESGKLVSEPKSEEVHGPEKQVAHPKRQGRGIFNWGADDANIDVVNDNK